MTGYRFSHAPARLCAAVAMAFTVLSTSVVLAQSPSAGGKEHTADQKAMMGKMAAADQKLTELVARMEAAQGEEKVAAIAAVVTELAVQRRQMREHGCMQSAMGGTMKKAPESATEAPEPDHAAHQPGK